MNFNRYIRVFARGVLALGLLPLCCNYAHAQLDSPNRAPQQDPDSLFVAAADSEPGKVAVIPLQSGVQVIFSYPAVTGRTIFTGNFSYSIEVPLGTTQLQIKIASITPNVDLDLFVRYSQDVAVSSGTIIYDFASARLGTADETITINSPAPGTYNIAILAATFNVSISGTIIATTSTAPVNSNSLVVPQFVNGGGWTTSLFLTNTSSSSENYTIRFYSNAGSPRRVPIQALATVDTITGTLNPGQVVVYETGDSASLEAGWALVVPSTTTAYRLNAFSVFRYRASGAPDTEAIVTPGTLSDRSLVMLYDQQNGFSTGVALVNPNSASVSLSVTVRDQTGNTIFSDTIALAGFNQQSFFIPQRYPLAANRKGSLVITASSGFSAVGLRFSPAGPFTSFPPLK